MAGMQEWLDWNPPRVRAMWECDEHDFVCQYLAKEQDKRDKAIVDEKYTLLKMRYLACTRIHNENSRMYCQEELMRFNDARRRLRTIGSRTLSNNEFDNRYGDERPFEPIRPDDYQRVPGHFSGFTHMPYPNTHREPIEVLQMDGEHRKPMADADRPSVSIRLFDYTRREVVLDLPPKKPETPKTLVSFDPEKQRKD